MDLKIKGEWEWAGDGYDRAFAATNDPRVVAVIERDDDRDVDVIDGDVYAPAFWSDIHGIRPAGSTFMDDESQEIADAYARVRSYFVNLHYVRGGRALDGELIAQRYLRMFRDATITTVKDSVIILNTPTWRKYVGVSDDVADPLEGDALEWRNVLDGDVFGIGYATDMDRVTDKDRVDLNDGAWDVEIACWGFIGKEYAKDEAAAFAAGAPELKPIDAPRVYRVVYAIDIEASTPRAAAQAAAAVLAKPGAPERGCYNVRARDGHETITIDLGEEEF